MNITAVLERADGFISASRVRRWCVPMLATQLILFVICVLGTHGMLVTLRYPATSDFVSFYAAGTLANGPHPDLVYDRVAHYAAEQAATQSGIQYFYFFYPPVFLLICATLATLPYSCALVLFDVVTVMACILTLRAIIRMPGKPWLLPILSFSPAIWCLGFGQNSFLTAALFGSGTLLLQSRRPIAAGLVLACLCYKPHTGLLIPLALAASGSARAIVSATGGVLLLGGASVLAFGSASWLGFLHAIVHAQDDFSSGQISSFNCSASVYGAASMLGASHAAAHIIEAVIGIVVTLAVLHSWSRKDLDGTHNALLISGTILVMPVVLFYDIVLLLVASAWLHHAARMTGNVPGERAGLAVLWLLSLACYPAAGALHLPVACICATGIFVLTLLRQYRSLFFTNTKHVSASFAIGGSGNLLLPWHHRSNENLGSLTSSTGTASCSPSPGP